MTTEQKALALVNAKIAEWEGRNMGLFTDEVAYGRCFEALCRAIEAHEADKKAFSDAITTFWPTKPAPEHFQRFILPEPDPLVEAMTECGLVFDDGPSGLSKHLRQALAARGYKIERIDND